MLWFMLETDNVHCYCLFTSLFTTSTRDTKPWVCVSRSVRLTGHRQTDKSHKSLINVPWLAHHSILNKDIWHWLQLFLKLLVRTEVQLFLIQSPAPLDVCPRSAGPGFKDDFKERRRNWKLLSGETSLMNRVIKLRRGSSDSAWPWKSIAIWSLSLIRLIVSQDSFELFG